MVYSLPNSKQLMDKFNRAHRRLETILNKYLNDIYDKCNENTVKRGYNVDKRAINLGPKPHNHYVDKDFSYEFY